MTLIEQIAQGENASLEFKEARPKDLLKFVKTVVAFANGRGGRLLFGVENETGRIVGIPREKVAAEMDAIVDAVSNTCSPRISIDVKPAVVDGKSLIAVDVKSGDEVHQFVLRNIRVGTELVGTARRDVYELPIDAIREAICNAVFHRDYLSPSCVYVAIYDDRLEVVSPGGLVREMTIEDARNGFSKIRNHAVGAALEYMGEVEGWGGGVSRYFVACEKMGLPPPVVAEESATLKVTFYRMRQTLTTGKAVAKSKEKSKERILAALASRPEWTTADLVRETGLSRSGIERNLRLLKAEGRLRRKGADNGGNWQVIEKSNEAN